ncbi:MAG: YihY/virulence factor BrkB family protein [Ignavibacteria bacterium]|nr:YihY/virulence factor BrkB family protein [Ignavibacteria bacterium]
MKKKDTIRKSYGWLRDKLSQQSIQWRLQFIWDNILYYYKGIYVSLDEHHIFIFAAGLAFSLFICIIPFVLILFWILGNFLDSSSVSMQIDSLIYTVIPYEEYADFVRELIFNRINELVKYKDVVGIIGLGGLLFAASGFSGSIRTVLNKIFGAKEDVNIILGKLRDFALIFVTMVVLVITSVLLPLLDLLKNASDVFMELKFLQHPFFQKLATKVFSMSISFLLITIVFSVLYRFVPIVKIRKRSVLIGALWAAGMWEGMKQLFGYYLSNFSTYGQIYGTYAFLVAVAFWIYYSSAVFIFGAEIGKLYNDNPLQKSNRKNKHPLTKEQKKILRTPKV